MMGNLHCKDLNVEGLFFLLSVSLQFGDVHMGQLFQREALHVALIPSFTSLLVLQLLNDVSWNY